MADTRYDVSLLGSNPCLQFRHLSQWCGSTRLNLGSFVADLKTSCTITEAKLQTNLEVLFSRVACGLKKIINGDFKRKFFSREEGAQKEKRFLTGRHVAWMIYEYFKVELNNDNVLSTSRDGMKP